MTTLHKFAVSRVFLGTLLCLPVLGCHVLRENSQGTTSTDLALDVNPTRLNFLLKIVDAFSVAPIPTTNSSTVLSTNLAEEIKSPSP